MSHKGTRCGCSYTLYKPLNMKSQIGKRNRRVKELLLELVSVASTYHGAVWAPHVIARPFLSLGSFSCFWSRRQKRWRPVQGVEADVEARGGGSGWRGAEPSGEPPVHRHRASCELWRISPNLGRWLNFGGRAGQRNLPKSRQGETPVKRTHRGSGSSGDDRAEARGKPRCFCQGRHAGGGGGSVCHRRA
jgi:hypothetical protein